jgi:hypothetical protein
VAALFSERMSMKFVNVHGDQVDPAVIAKKHKKAKVVTDNSDKSFHKGWRVVGFSGEILAEAREAHDKERSRKLTDKHAPKDIGPFDLASYISLNKPKPVRSKPYEMREAALQCMAMAEKAGWQFLQIIECTQGQAPAASMF